MNNIDRLIAELCPKGVEHLAIGEFCVLRRGESVTKNSTNPGPIPVIAGGQQPAYFIDKANRSGETIVVSSSGAYAGFVSYWDIPIFVSDAFSIEAKSDFCLKYLYYVLKNRQESIHSLKKGGGVPHVHVSDLAPMIIPLPPLPVQEEIVRILDTFSSTVAELEQKLNAERAARIRQYEHYRDELLTFESKSKIMEKLLANLCPDGVEYMRLGDVSLIFRGVTYSKSAEVSTTKGYKILRANNINLASNTINFEDVRIISDSVKVNSDQKLRKDDIFICTASGSKDHIGKVAFIYTDLDYYFGGFMAVIRTQQLLVSRFLFHVLTGLSFSTYLENTLNSSTINNLNSTILNGFRVPIPPLPVQEEIVRILDRFDALVNDLKTGLPAEIALRRKQYEHYRDTLLTFTQTN